MKLTKSQLKQVIKEELGKLLQEQGGLRGRSDAAFGDLTRRTQPQQRQRQQAPARQSTLAQVGLNRINRFRQWTGNKPLTKLHWKRYLQLEKDPKYAKAIANLIKDLLTWERDNKAKAQRQPGQPAPKRTATTKVTHCKNWRQYTDYDAFNKCRAAGYQAAMKKNPKRIRRLARNIAAQRCSQRPNKFCGNKPCGVCLDKKATPKQQGVGK